MDWEPVQCLFSVYTLWSPTNPFNIIKARRTKNIWLKTSRHAYLEGSFGLSLFRLIIMDGLINDVMMFLYSLYIFGQDSIARIQAQLKLLNKRLYYKLYEHFSDDDLLTFQLFSLLISSLQFVQAFLFQDHLLQHDGSLSERHPLTDWLKPQQRQPQTKQEVSRKSWRVSGVRVKDDDDRLPVTLRRCEYFHRHEVEGSSIFLWRQKDK